ncbi:hypothetical protein ABL78_0949 [Leptomonas seymouri]|uniref:PDZ domain-containing protein n=1 Tax=Leptomonas seymouri TaxID=5684 RepID=A0A0N1I1F1_LEPSE|nr:hypothetical protein ABL78_0949 [Leptomonas seymouri]|eukprot:KPI89981.1 hypothetical protein ABL78_0949 [Leptomonas seymouri]
MSYPNASIYSDVADVLDSIRDNVEAYLTIMEEEDAQASTESTGSSNEHSLVTAAMVNSPCRLYIKKNGPLVIGLSESVQSVLSDLVEKERQTLCDASPQAQQHTSAGSAVDAARSEAVRTLATRKLGQLMENAHTMHRVVKQQQQQRRSQRFGTPLRAPADNGANGNDMRMKQHLRVITHDLEDTEHLLRIVFPEVPPPSVILSPTAAAPSAPSSSLTQDRLRSPPPAFSHSGRSYSPERHVTAAASAYSSSCTPRHSVSTAPYVRRSESVDTSRMPRLSSPNESNLASYDVGDITRVSALTGRTEDSVLCSPDASRLSSPLSTPTQTAGPPKSSRGCLEVDGNYSSAGEGHDSDVHEHGSPSSFSNVLEPSSQATRGGLTSNPVFCRPSAGNNGSSMDHSGDGTSSAFNRALMSGGRTLSGVFSGVMQLASFSSQPPLPTAYAADSANSSTITTDSKEAKGHGNKTSTRVDGVSSRKARVQGDSPLPSSPPIKEGRGARQYDGAMQTIAAAEVPRGILKTSSSRLGSPPAMVEGNNGRNSASRSSGLTSPGTSRPVVQFADDVLDHTNAEKGGNGADNYYYSSSSGSTASEIFGNSYGSDGGYGRANGPLTETRHPHSTNESSSGSIGSGRLRGLPAGLPPRSPRQADVLPFQASVVGGQRPPLAPTPSSSCCLLTPTRNVWVTTTHSQRLPGELWGDIVKANRNAVEEVWREDVIDLFNYGEPEPVLFLDDVTDIRFNFVDGHLYIRFDLEHQRSLNESEINLRLSLCSYPFMTGLYEDYFSEYQAQEFDPIEDSSSTKRNSSTPMRDSTWLDASTLSSPYRESRGDRSEPARPATTVNLSLPALQTLDSFTHEDYASAVSPLSIPTDNDDSRTASITGESAASFPFTPKSGSKAALPPLSEAFIATADDRMPKRRSSSATTAVSTTPTSPTQAATVLLGSNSNGGVSLAIAPRRNASRSEDNLNTAAYASAVRTSSSSSLSLPGGPSPTSFAVVARQRDGASSSPHTSSSAASTPSSVSKVRSHVHTIRIPGQHWEAVTGRVPENNLNDVFAVDVGAALGVLPQEARASCQRIRFYLDSNLVVKFRWCNAELPRPGAVLLTAAEVEARLADYSFPSLRQVYAETCSALRLSDNIASGVAEAKEATSDERKLLKEDLEGSLSSIPEAQCTLPKVAELDETPLLESDRMKYSADMQHRGEGAPSCSSSVSPSSHSLDIHVTITQGKKATPAHTHKCEATTVTPTTTAGKEPIARSHEAAKVDAEAAPSPRESSPDPVAATHLTRIGRRHANTPAEAKPSATIPQPTKLSIEPSRSRSSQQHTNALPPPSNCMSSNVTLPATAASAAPRERMQNHSNDSVTRVRSPLRGTGSSTHAQAVSAAATTSTATTTLNRLARQHHVTLKTLLQWNPSLAQIDPNKLIPFPDSLAEPRVAPPPSALKNTTAITPATNATAAERASSKPESQTSADTQPTPAEAAIASTQPSAIPRHTSALRHNEGGIVASLRYRPRLAPKEGSTAHMTSACAPTATSQRNPSHLTVAEPASAHHADPSTTAAGKPEELPKRTMSIPIASRLPPPLSVDDIEARRTPRNAPGAPSAIPLVVVAAAKSTPQPKPSSTSSTSTAAAAVPAADNPRSGNCAGASDSLKHAAPSHAASAEKQSIGEAATAIARHHSNGSTKKQPSSAPRAREASPRSAQAAAGAAQPDHKVYHLPPEILGLDPMLLPSGKVHITSGSLSVPRSARRQQPGLLGGQDTGHSISSRIHVSGHGRDPENVSALIAERVLGLRLSGLTVESVRRRGVAAEAGIQVGDTLRTMDGQILGSESDFYRGVHHNNQQQQSDNTGEHTLFVTAVNARGAPVTYRLCLPPPCSADGTAVPSSSALLAPSAQQRQLPAQSGRTASVQARLALQSAALPRSLAAAASSRITAAMKRGEQVEAIPVTRTRVNSVGVATREIRAPRSYSSRVLRGTNAPEKVHTTASGAPASLSVRQLGHDNGSATRARAQP